MKPHLLLILFATAVLAINQNSQQSETSPDNICGRVEDRKCISGGVLNGKIVSVESPPYPQQAQEKQIEGTVTVQLVFNEDGEVISASPVSGPEELWAASVKAAVTTRFHPIKLSGKPIKMQGVLLVNFKNGKVDIPEYTGTAPVSLPTRP
jgi:TonB family protein